MRITPEELAARYRAMSDEELIGLDRADLTDTARQCYDREVERRKLTFRPEDDESEPGAGATDTPGGRWVCAGLFRTPDEGEFVRQMLESAGIAARLEGGDLLWLGGSSYTSTRVLVPQVMENDAIGLIETQAAEQEYVARAAAEISPMTIMARFEDGIFKPLEPVELEEGTEFEIRLRATPSARRS